jgi:hypothetical protein
VNEGRVRQVAITTDILVSSLLPGIVVGAIAGGWLRSWIVFVGTSAVVTFLVLQVLLASERASVQSSVISAINFARANASRLRDSLRTVEEALAAAEKAFVAGRYADYLDQLSLASESLLMLTPAVKAVADMGNWVPWRLSSTQHSYPPFTHLVNVPSIKAAIEHYATVLGFVDRDIRCVALVEHRRATNARSGGISHPATAAEMRKHFRDYSD